MDNLEIEKDRSDVIVENISYFPNAILSKTILKKLTRNITATSFDKGEESKAVTKIKFNL